MRFAYEGIEDLRVNENGELEIILADSKSETTDFTDSTDKKNPKSEIPEAGWALPTTPEGSELAAEPSKIIQRRPYIYQEIDGKRVEVAGEFRVLSLESGVKKLAARNPKPKTRNPQPETSNGQSATRNPQFTYGFHVAAYDTARTLIIDPILEYSTYLGGSGNDFGYGIAVDGTGSAYVTGITPGSGFPIVGTTTAHGGNDDVFVTKLGTSGSSIEYSTYLGGSSGDYGYGIAVDGAGSAYVTGYTASSGFPIVGTTTPHDGGDDVFVTKLGTSGSSIEYSTYLGGSGYDYGYGIAVDGTGSAYVTGYTQGGFPIVGTTTAFGGIVDVFVTKLGTSGSSIEYSTYLGGTSVDYGYGIAVDGTGTAYVTGYTASSGFPIVGTTTTYRGGSYDAFVTKLGTSGSSIEYSTYLGGSDSDYGRGIAVDGTGPAYVTGYTYSANFPIVGTTTAHGGNADVFVTKLGTRTTDVEILYSTYLGGSGDDWGYGIAVDSAGSAYVTGNASSGFPIVGTTTAYGGGTYDAFISKFIFTPWVVTGSATSVTTTSATLYGTASAVGLPTTAMFSYGVISGSYDNTSTTFSVTGENTAVDIAISGLSAGTLYYYQIVANNSAGTSTGSEQSFTTSSSGGGGGWEPPAVTISVTSTTPASGATDVSVDTTISAKFSMLINGSTVSTDSIYVSDADGNKIEGAASTDSYSAVFIPSGNLSYDTTYTAVATTKIQAANWAGTQMDSNYSWSFTTESAPIVPTPTPAVTTSPTPIPVVVATQTSTPATTPTLLAVATPTPAITEETPIPSMTPTLTPTPSLTPTPVTEETPIPSMMPTLTPIPTSSPSLTPAPSPTPTPVYEGSVALSKEVAYLYGDTVIVTVADSDRNTGAETEEILTTAIKITGDNYYTGNDLLLDLNEDGADSGTFLATIKTSTTTSGGADSAERSNIGVVYAIQDGTVTMAYSPDAFVSVAKKLSFSSFDAQISFDRPVYRIGEYAGITLTDAESNADHETAETLTNDVYIDTSSFNTTGVRMLETGTDTGIFRGSIQISADSTLAYERIQAAEGNTLTASCYDETTTTGFPQLVTDTCSVAVLTAPTATPPVIPSPTPTQKPSPSPSPTPSASPSPTPCAGGIDAEEITASPDSLELEKREEGEVTVTVTGADGCVVEGVRVTRKIATSDKRKIKVKPSSRKTDAEGKAIFTIKVKKVKCSKNEDCTATVKFKAKGVKEKAEVTVWLVK